LKNSAKPMDVKRIILQEHAKVLDRQSVPPVVEP
jgi:hypothetical protein